jgi:hypothetical protein
LHPLAVGSITGNGISINVEAQDDGVGGGSEHDVKFGDVAGVGQQDVDRHFFVVHVDFLQAVDDGFQ